MQAWRRRPFGTIEKLARGAVWFTLFLGTMVAHERIREEIGSDAYFGALAVEGSAHPFALLYLKEPLKLDYLWAALCIVGAVYFIFRSRWAGG